MSESPVCETYDISSPDVFTRDVKCNLYSQFEDEGESENYMNIYARIRPLLSEEKNRGFKECIAVVDEKTVRVVIPENSSKYKNSRVKGAEEYTFTAAFGPEVGQFVFFQETMLTCMENFVKGLNSLIFNYGITGSGKTYTLQGNSDNPGIIPMSLRLYFAVLEDQIMSDIVVKPSMYNGITALSEAEQQKEYMLKYELLKQYDNECESVSGSFINSNPKSFANMLCNLFSDSYEAETRQTTLCAEDMASAQAATLMKENVKRIADDQVGVCNIWISFVEIYNENIFDLLQPVDQRTINSRRRLNLGEDKNGNVYIKGAREICVFNSDEALRILNIGRRNLSIASTKMNYQSSRSHCIYTIKVIRIPDKRDSTFAKINRFSFCDLAGSERASKTQTSGIRLKEAGSINTSLLVLGRCIESLRLNQMGREKRVIPFRESKLTRIFSGFFLGQGKAVMIANASPSDYTFDETLHVLKFSALAKKIMVSSFFSDASSSIQSICNQFEMLNNISSCNESLESVDTDSSIIQMKDELIEKLLSLVDEFQKKEQEMADLVVKVREDVCDEYREYSDQLLEDQRIRYEEEREKLRQIYEKRHAAMEKMYEDIIKGYKDQLNDSDTEESFASEKSVNVSRSSEILDSSLKSESSISDNNQSKLPMQELKSEQNVISKLEEKVINLTRQLESAKSDAEEKSLKLSEFETLNSNYKLKFEELQHIHSSLLSGKEGLEKILAVANEDRETLQADIELKSSCLADLEERNNNCKLRIEELQCDNQNITSEKIRMEERMSVLTKQLESIKSDAESKSLKLSEFETLTDSYRAKIEELQEIHLSLLSSKKELEENLAVANGSREAVEADIKQKSSYSVELEEQINVLRKENEDLKKKILDLNIVKTSYEANVDNLNKTISLLNEKLNIRQLSDSLARKLQDKLDHSSALEDEIQKYKEEIRQLKRKSVEFSNFRVICENDLKKLQNKNSELDQELQSAYKTVNDLQEKESTSLALEKEIQMYKQEIKVLKETHQSISIEKSELEEKMSLCDKNSQELLIQLEEFKNQVKEYKEEIRQLKRSSVEFSNYRVICENDLKKLRNKNSELEQELKTAYKTIDDVQKELQLKETMLLEFEKEIDIYKQEIKVLKESHESISFEKTEMEEKLSSYDVKNSQELLKQLEELENRNEMYELQILQLKEGQENDELKLKLDLKLANDDIKKKALEVEELQKRSSKCELYVEELQLDKEKLISEKLELEEKITFMGEEFKRVKCEAEHKSSKLAEFENLNNNYKLEIIKEQQKCISLTSEKEELENELALVINQLESLQADVEIKSSNLLELEQQMKTYSIELENLKRDYQNLQIDKLEIVKEIQEVPVKQMDDVERLQKLSTIENKYEEKITQLKENLKFTEEEKQSLMVIISNKEKKIGDVENELLRINEQLKTAKSDVLAKSTTIEDLKDNISKLKKEVERKSLELETCIKDLEKTKTEHDSFKDKCKEFEETLTLLQKDKEKLLDELVSEKRVLDDLYKLVILLENCEMQATNKTKQVKNTILIQKSEIVELKQRIQSRESSIEELEKALSDAQMNLKEFQALYEEKKKEAEEVKKETLAKKEANEVKKETLPKIKEASEVKKETLPKKSATIKEKNLPEAEKNSNVKEKAKILKKSASVKEKENLHRMPSTRSLRQKTTKVQDISFSSVDSNNAEREVPSRRNLKRVSDEDFEPDSKQTSKKVKAAPANKIPVRTTRKKVNIEEDKTKNLSPLQKVAYGVSSRFRNIADNISKMSSPIQTRGRKKLFNPDSSSSLKSDKVARGKKV